MNDSPETFAEDSSVPKNRLGRFLLIMCGIGALIFISHSWKSRQPVAEIAVKGTEALTPEEVLNNLDTSLRTQTVDAVQLALVKEEVEKNPLVKAAVVERRGVRGIEIKVEERVPVAALIGADGGTILIDSEGKVLPYSRFAHKADVPLIRGVIDHGKIDTAFLKEAMTILQQFGGSNDVTQLISEIECSGSTKTFSIISDLGVDIFLGTREILPHSLQKLRELLKSPGKNGNILRDVEYIDLRWQGRVITRPRKTDA